MDQLILEFGRKGYDDLHMIQQLGGDRVLGRGLVDVKTEQIESAETIAQRIQLVAMVEGIMAVRHTLPAASGQEPTVEQGA